jgi:hypothetical protein
VSTPDNSEPGLTHRSDSDFETQHGAPAVQHDRGLLLVGGSLRRPGQNGDGPGGLDGGFALDVDARRHGPGVVDQGRRCCSELIGRDGQFYLLEVVHSGS